MSITYSAILGTDGRIHVYEKLELLQLARRYPCRGESASSFLSILVGVYITCVSLTYSLD